MKSLKEIKSQFSNEKFDLDHEANMVQSRIISVILEAIEDQKLNQSELSERTGLTQPFISALLNIRKKLNMEHIALFQNALGIILQPPKVLSKNDHKKKFYTESEGYELNTSVINVILYTHPLDDVMDNYTQTALSKSEWSHRSRHPFTRKKTSTKPNCLFEV